MIGDCCDFKFRRLTVEGPRLRLDAVLLLTMATVVYTKRISYESFSQ